MFERIWYDKQFIFRSIALKVRLNPSRLADILRGIFAHVPA